MNLHTLAMGGVFTCYSIATLAYVFDGKPWMAATLGFYAISIATLYMAGNN
jgi:hypothetical protein